ncbi:MAG: biopolymer transporter ExbD [Gemmatimonadales bacterium]
MALPIRHVAGPVETQLDAAPMVDVLFVLLLLFLLAQAFVRQVLPAGAAPISATPATIAIDDPVVLDITASGFLINGQPIPDTQLKSQLQAIYTRRAAKVLFVRPAADRSRPQVALVVRRARAAGVAATALLPAGP